MTVKAPPRLSSSSVAGGSAGLGWRRSGIISGVMAAGMSPASACSAVTISGSKGGWGASAPVGAVGDVSVTGPPGAGRPIVTVVTILEA
ncbi:hypothetical protein [Modestobacter sp. URMC 112]